ncbi:winged helix-turn-helix transcriptional regulator [Eudoraea algarum]|uniref:winged helix-turn-helix transcriptional regulator n=1 Tax=Eudoraea algarum TaxID=3417568 RepID=UPI003F5D4F6D
METITDTQRLRVAVKLKKMFGHVNPKDPPEICPIRDVMALASDKWSILIILYLGYFPVLRFNELKRKVYGISGKILSERLKSLEVDGYLSRELFPEVPIRVEYRLTDFGHSYLQKLMELTEWAEKYSNRVITNRAKHS